MVEISFCGACKYYIGLAEDKSTRYCEAFPDGRKDFEPAQGEKCADGFSFQPKDEYKDLFDIKE